MSENKMFEDFLDRLIEEDRIKKEDPFFHTRLSARISSTAARRTAGGSFSFSLLMMTFLVIFGIASGFLVGQGIHSKFVMKKTALRQSELKNYSEENNISVFNPDNNDNLLLK